MRFSQTIFLLFFLFSFFCSYSAYAVDKTLLIVKEDSVYNPALHIEYLVDAEGQLKIADILRKDQQIRFRPVINKTPHFGLKMAAIWFKLNIKNLADIEPYLELENASIDTIEYFLFNQTGQIVHHELTGYFQKVKERSVRTSDILINLHIADKELYTCYLRFQTNTMSLILPIKIASLETFYERKHHATIWQGIYMGLMLFLVIYNLFLFYSIRDFTYLYFGLFIVCLGIMFADLKGFGLEYIWQDYTVFNNRTPVYGGLAGIFLVLFTRRFLKSFENTPRMDTWLLAMVFFYLMAFGLYLAGFTFIAAQIVIFNSLMTLFTMMFVALKVWMDGYLPAKYYLLSWSFFTTGLIIYIFREFGFIQVNVFIGNILHISSTISTLFMSFALSKKINIYIEKRNEAQELALRTARENERLVSNQNQILEVKVIERTAELEQSIAALQKKGMELNEANSFKDKIFSIISHDLKSPIATLTGLLQVMKMKTLNEEEKNKVVTNLEIALKATKNLLDNMLAWAIKSDRKTIETNEILLYEIVEEIINLYRQQAESKLITLENKVDPNFYIVTNKNMVQLVLRNLVSNAIKFTRKTGSVDIGYEVDYLNVHLIVKDTGIGMTPEFIDKLFTPKTHVSTPGTENEKGTGLGLILCKEFLEKIDGSIAVSSQPGIGTTFTVKLKNAVPVLETVQVSSLKEN